METIRVRIHDRDGAGICRIVEEKEMTMHEFAELFELAEEQSRREWDKMPVRINHVLWCVVYREGFREYGRADVYVHGLAYTDNAFAHAFFHAGVWKAYAHHRPDHGAIYVRTSIFKHK